MPAHTLDDPTVVGDELVAFLERFLQSDDGAQAAAMSASLDAPPVLELRNVVAGYGSPGPDGIPGTADDVPLATAEGSLVASYNRGMRVLSECGGVKTTVVEDSMQRAPVFIFDDALEAREFGDWIERHEDYQDLLA